MKILILNRRDIKNPDGGGAEVYTHEISAGLTKKYPCEVVVFASRFNGSTEEEVVDGVKHVRKGNEVTVHLWGFLFALKQRKNFDLIIDEFNGIGFFTFFFSNSMLLIHQLYKRFWFRELNVFGIIPYIIEPLLLRLYRKHPAVTVSNSTKEDLEGLGFDNISIVMNAVRQEKGDIIPEKPVQPTLLFLGRLKSTKKPEDAVEIFKRVKALIPSVRLWIIGRGPMEKELRKKSAGLDDITFWGRIDENRKKELLREAHILLVPGVREGFGINVIEAASAGTPAVGYNVHGLRDSIVHGKTGFLVKNIDEAVAIVKEMIEQKETYKKISQSCINYVKDFTWDSRVKEFWQSIQSARGNGK
jgi:glycosyltransferase involved in cell wall biosynthesis